MTRFSRHCATGDGARIAYQLEGDGPAVAFTHPYAMPRGGAPAVAGLCMVTVWPRGFGASTPARSRSDYGLVVGSRDLDAVRVDLGLNQWSLWGLSMGGFVSLLYAVDHPDVLDSLILDSTAASYEYARDPQSMWPAVTASARRGTPVLQAMREAQQDDPIAVTAAAIADLETNTDALGVILDRLVEYDVRPRLAEIRCPALILAGEHDRQCTPRQAQELADGMPQATLRLYADIGHGVLHTGRRDVRDAVVAFVTDAAARSARR